MAMGQRNKIFFVVVAVYFSSYFTFKFLFSRISFDDALMVSVALPIIIGSVRTNCWRFAANVRLELQASTE